jgi:nitrate reductase (NAD(P)H)
MVPNSWKVTIQDHPGSTWDDILSEPDWDIGHNHRVGYNNKDNRIAGFSSEYDEYRKESERAQEHYENAKDGKKQGDLVNFRDVIKNQKVR